MTLSCSCDDWDGEGVGFWKPEEFRPLKTGRAKRCKSCGEKIRPGETCIEFERFKYPEDEVEIKIYGENSDTEIPRASWFLCEPCGEIYLNLDDLGFCVNPDEKMDELLNEYRENYQKNNGLFQLEVGDI